MSDTPETDLEDDLYLECASPCIVKESTGAIFTGDFVPAEFARRLERERDKARATVGKWRLISASMADDNSWLESERDELRQVIRDVDKAFPDLAEFQDKDGRSLKWLADKIQKAKGEV
jgi:hypothetical protein